MKKILMISLFFLTLMNKRITAQETKSFQISAGIGVKYHRYIPYEKDKYWPEEADRYLPNFAFTIEGAKDFWASGKHFIGLEIIGYPDTYANSPMYTKDFSLILNIFYKRNIYLTKKIAFEHDIGFGLFSNDLASFLNIFTNFQIKYALTNFDFFIKNNFRWGFLFFGKNLPWVITTGVSIKI